MRNLRGEIMKCKSGETFYINAINLTCRQIDILRSMIKAGECKPIQSEVKKAYKDVDAVMCGDVIVPQMMYERR